MRSRIVFVALSGCFMEFHQGNGRSATEDRVVGAFDGVTAATSIPVDVTAGPESGVSVTCDSNLIEFIVTDVNDGDLVVRTVQRGGVWVNIDPTVDCRVHITTPGVAKLASTGSGLLTASGDDLEGLRAVTSTGSGGLVVFGHAVAPEVVVTSTGSGDIAIDAVVATDLTVMVSGSGEVDVSNGSAATVDLTITGSGDVDLAGVASDDVHAVLSGSGSGQVTVADELSATLTGSGDLVVFGNPDHHDVTETGSGRVHFE